MHEAYKSFVVSNKTVYKVIVEGKYSRKVIVFTVLVKINDCVVITIIKMPPPPLPSPPAAYVVRGADAGLPQRDAATGRQPRPQAPGQGDGLVTQDAVWRL